MKRLKQIVLWLGILVAVLVALPFFIPLNAYTPQIERLASAKLGEPVKIDSFHAWLLPTPHATLKGISVGKGEDIEVAKVSIEPDIGSLFQPVKVIESVEIDGLKLRQDIFSKIPLWAKSSGGPAPTISIRKIRLRNLVLMLKKQTLGPFNVEASVTGSNLENALIASADEKLKVTVKPEKNYYLLDVSAKNWQPPIPQLPQPVLIDELSLRGKATTQDLNLPQINAKLYGGTVTGKMTASWGDDWKVSGEFHTKDVETGTLVQMFSKTSVSGKLTADATVTGSGKTAEQLIDNPGGEATFSVADGVLHNMDLISAATTFISKNGVHGGETKFEQLTGKAYYADKKARFRNIRVVSGLLGADGNVDISPAQELSGTVSVKVKKGINLVSVPLAISGTVSDPYLRPTAGAMAGAAAGTAILGPVLGTSIGIKAGEFTQNLFSKKDKDEEKDKEKKQPQPKPAPRESSPAPFSSSPSK